MWERTTPTCPEPNILPSSGTPSAARKRTGSDMASASVSTMSGNRDVDAGAAVGEGCPPFDWACRPGPQAVASMSEATSAIHPRIPQKDTEDSPTVVFVAAARVDAS